MEPLAGTGTGAARVDGRGLLALPGIVNTHAHVDKSWCGLGLGLRGLEVVREAAASFDGALDVQLVTFPQDGVLRRPGVLEQYARASGLVRDEDLHRVVELATRAAGRFVGREVHDVVPGARADVVLLDAENPMDALVRTPERALVVAGGRALHGG